MSAGNDGENGAAEETHEEPSTEEPHDSRTSARVARDGDRVIGESGAQRRSDVRSALRPLESPAPHPAPEAGPRGLPTPRSRRVLETVLALTRAVRVDMTTEEIVCRYVDALERLFPLRRWMIRMRHNGSHDLETVYCSGALNPSDSARPRLSRQAVARHDLPPSILTDIDIEILDEYVPYYAGSGGGFDVPLLDGDDLVGIVAVEYPEGVVEPEDDQSYIVQLGLQLAGALRNARLLDESRYLRDYLSKLLDHANAPIIVVGREREIRVVNRAFLAITGMEKVELLGRDVGELLSDTERQTLMPVFARALGGEPTANLEMDIPRRKGGPVRFSLNTASVVNADGEVEAIIAIGRDLTEVRRLQEQVIQAEKLATLGQLAAGVVHELNNPLTSISVYSDYLLKKSTVQARDPDDVEKLGRIVDSAERILRFTRDLVTYARPTSEEPRRVSIAEVLDQSLVFCEHVIRDSGVQIHKRYDDSVAPLFAIKSQLHQVFINLVTNACHAMPSGTGHLVIDTRIDASGDLIVRVSDDGVGIPEEQIAQIFEPFYSTKGEGVGTGLGLSIVRNIVQQHDGDIHVESTPHRGTTFVVRLPTRRAER